MPEERLFCLSAADWMLRIDNSGATWGLLGTVDGYSTVDGWMDGRWLGGREMTVAVLQKACLDVRPTGRLAGRLDVRVARYVCDCLRHGTELCMGVINAAHELF